MNWQKLVVPVMGIVFVAAAWRSFGWAGVAFAAGAIVLWVLLHFTRMMTVLKRAAERPIGYVGSAVMLNARLKPNVSLLHVVAMTKALGEQLSAKDAQPEVYRWTDGTQSHVTCEFAAGKLVKWTLVRPPAEPEGSPAPAP